LHRGDFKLKIEINFLIVGHTHCKIDQNFSVLSTAIKAAFFVASPMAMRALIGKAHAKINERPRFVYILYVYYLAHNLCS
jgi:hypothetical protein